jgi:hypothetical protein
LVGIPHGHWKTTTFVAGIASAGIVATDHERVSIDPHIHPNEKPNQRCFATTPPAFFSGIVALSMSGKFPLLIVQIRLRESTFSRSRVDQ